MDADLYDLVAFIKYHLKKFLLALFLLSLLIFIFINWSVDGRPRFQVSFFLDLNSLCISDVYICEFNEHHFLNDLFSALSSQDAWSDLSEDPNSDMLGNGWADYEQGRENSLIVNLSKSLPHDFRLSSVARAAGYEVTVSGVAPSMIMVEVFQQAVYTSAVEVANKLQQRRALSILSYLDIVEGEYTQSADNADLDLSYVSNNVIVIRRDVSTFVEFGTYQGFVARPVTLIGGDTKVSVSRFSSLYIKILFSLFVALTLDILGCAFLVMRSEKIYSFSQILRNKNFKTIGTFSVSKISSDRSLVVRNVILELFERSEAQTVRILLTCRLNDETHRMVVSSFSKLFGQFDIIVTSEHNKYGHLVVVLQLCSANGPKSDSAKQVDVNAVCFGKSNLNEFLSVISIGAGADVLHRFLLGVDLPSV